MREQFEKLPEIKEMLLNNDELKWCYETNRYINHRVFQDAETGYINGARYAFQEQQKSHQQEIERLKTELLAAEAEIARLQSRVDGAMDFYNTAKSDVNIGMIRMAQYLKGEVK